jgi:hypothetical protein
MTDTFGPSNDSIPDIEFRIAERTAREFERTQAANVRFAALTPARKRVALARDVLRWIANGKLKPAGRDANDGGGGSTYLEVFYNRSNEDRPWANSVTTRELQEVGKVNGYVCTACAIGGLIAVAAERDACRLFTDDGEFIPNCTGSSAPSAIRREMASHNLFETCQLVLVEQAYECGEGIGYPGSFIDSGEVTEGEVDAARAFGKLYRTRAERLKAIMENIIDNGGTFIP